MESSGELCAVAYRCLAWRGRGASYTLSPPASIHILSFNPGETEPSTHPQRTHLDDDAKRREREGAETSRGEAHRSKESVEGLGRMGSC